MPNYQNKRLAATRLVMAAMATLCAALPAWALPPTPDHVVIVIEENKNFGQVIGSPSAPYINSLAAGGMNFTNFFGVTHPSQPNYLELFSGSSQGVVDDTVPPVGSPYTTANLAAALSAAGASFTGYSETLPAAGSTVNSSTTVVGQNQYVRKHNPWVNWQGGGANQLPTSVNQPFSSFPSDYNLLPRVSIVVPNEQNDMHDGSIAQGDTWLQTNLGGYATWAQTHNSLLIVTFDEDNGGLRNRIPTIFYGPMMRVGANSDTHTLHDLLRTVGDMYGAAPPGAAANVQPISGVFTTDPTQTTLSFQQGSSGYTSSHDTYIDQSAPATANGTNVQVVADGSPLNQGLIRFDNLFGSGPGQIPATGTTIVSAKLSILTGSVGGDASGDLVALNRMLIDWTDGATWNTSPGGDGVQNNGVEAIAASEFSVTPNQNGNYAIFDVTASIRAWLANPAINYGWLVRNASGTDGWRFSSAEAAAVGDRPRLEIVFRAQSAADLPEPAGMTVGLVVLIVGAALCRRMRPSRAASPSAV